MKCKEILNSWLDRKLYAGVMFGAAFGEFLVYNWGASDAFQAGMGIIFGIGWLGMTLDIGRYVLEDGRKDEDEGF